MTVNPREFAVVAAAGIKLHATLIELIEKAYIAGHDAGRLGWELKTNKESK